MGSSVIEGLPRTGVDLFTTFATEEEFRLLKSLPFGKVSIASSSACSNSFKDCSRSHAKSAIPRLAVLRYLNGPGRVFLQIMFDEVNCPGVETFGPTLCLNLLCKAFRLGF